MNRNYRSHVLDLKIPPAVLVAFTGALMWLASAATSATAFVIPGRSLGAAILMLTGVTIAGLGVASFRRAKTTVNPIRKVLSSMRAHRVRALLMGGQACVFYGAAEFSRSIQADDLEAFCEVEEALRDIQRGSPSKLAIRLAGHDKGIGINAAMSQIIAAWANSSPPRAELIFDRLPQDGTVAKENNYLEILPLAAMCMASDQCLLGF